MKSKNIESIDPYIYSNYFNINIFVFDFVTNEIILYYPEDEFIPYKLNILISKKNDLYQPLTYKNDNSRFFKYNSTILENIIYKNKLKIFSLNNKLKKFNICKNINLMLKKYDNIDLNKIIIGLKKEDLKNIISSESDSINFDSESSDYDLDFNGLTEDINNIIIDSNTELIKKLKGYSKSKFNKEKKSNLVEYLSKLNNNNNNNNYNTKTKKFLIDEIKSIINKSI